MAILTMRKYKLVMLMKSDVKKERRDKLFADVKNWVGSEVKDDTVKELGEKKLAYVINQNKKGAYYIMEFGAETVATDFEKKIGMQEDVLRHLLVRNK